MISEYLQAYTASIVFLGNFNPVIVQPFWLAHKRLIREQEATSAVIEVIHNELVKYNFGWVTIEITKQRFVAQSTQEPYFDLMKDLACGIFKNLPETPIKTLGINRDKHFGLPDKETYYKVGNTLAPLKLWDDVLKDPRLLDLKIIEERRTDTMSGHYVVQVRPSDIIPKGFNGVSVSSNDEYRFDGDGRNAEMVNILIDSWKPSGKRFDEILEKLWRNINK